MYIGTFRKVHIRNLTLSSTYWVSNPAASVLPMSPRYGRKHPLLQHTSLLRWPRDALWLIQVHLSKPIDDGGYRECGSTKLNSHVLITAPGRHLLRISLRSVVKTVQLTPSSPKPTSTKPWNRTFWQTIWLKKIIINNFLTNNNKSFSFPKLIGTVICSRFKYKCFWFYKGQPTRVPKLFNVFWISFIIFSLVLFNLSICLLCLVWPSNLHQNTSPVEYRCSLW